MTDPWPPGACTGLGSLPGTDPIEASKLVLGELPDLPHLPELPDRGPGADLVGRGVALLVDLPTQWQLGRWSLTGAAGRDVRRACDWLRWDVDGFAELAQDATVVKVQVCGPMTLAASVELPNLHKVLTDHGAFRDLAASLAEGVRLHVADIERRLPGAAVVLQVDEPSLPAVLAGQVPTPSGYGTVRALDVATARSALAAVLDAAGERRRVVHCCASDAPLRLLAEAGASAVSVDADLLGSGQLDSIGELVEAGVSLWLGVVPGVDARISFEAVRDRVRTLWGRLGFEPGLLAQRVVATPACGLAGASEDYVRRAMAVLREAGRSLAE